MSPLAQIMQRRKLGGRQLARQAGLGIGTIPSLLNAQSPGDSGTYKKLGAALSLDWSKLERQMHEWYEQIQKARAEARARNLQPERASQPPEEELVPVSKEAREIFGEILEEFGHDVAALIEGKEGLTAFFGALVVEAKVWRGADADAIERFKRRVKAAIEEWVRRKKAADGHPPSPDPGGGQPE